MKKTWVIKGEYFYSPHHKYEGVFELYWVDKDKVSRCIHNFCLEEVALALAQEDKAWRKLGCKISHKTSVDWEVEAKEREKLMESPKKFVSDSEDQPEEHDLEQAKKEARKRRREARKNKI